MEKVKQTLYQIRIKTNNLGLTGEGDSADFKLVL
jgi:hypothetical protein